MEQQPGLFEEPPPTPTIRRPALDRDVIDQINRERADPPPKVDGEDLKEAGCSRVLDGASEDWKFEFEAAVVKLAISGEEFTVDEVHEQMTMKPQHPNAVGAMMRMLGQRGYFRRVGYRKSCRTAAHARIVPVYKGGFGK